MVGNWIATALLALALISSAAAYIAESIQCPTTEYPDFHIGYGDSPVVFSGCVDKCTYGTVTDPTDTFCIACGEAFENCASCSFNVDGVLGCDLCSGGTAKADYPYSDNRGATPTDPKCSLSREPVPKEIIFVSDLFLPNVQPEAFEANFESYTEQLYLAATLGGSVPAANASLFELVWGPGYSGLGVYVGLVFTYSTDVTPFNSSIVLENPIPFVDMAKSVTSLVYSTFGSVGFVDPKPNGIAATQLCPVGYVPSAHFRYNWANATYTIYSGCRTACVYGTLESPQDVCLNCNAIPDCATCSYDMTGTIVCDTCQGGTKPDYPVSDNRRATPYDPQCAPTGKKSSPNALTIEHAMVVNVFPDIVDANGTNVAKAAFEEAMIEHFTLHGNAEAIRYSSIEFVYEEANGTDKINVTLIALYEAPPFDYQSEELFQLPIYAMVSNAAYFAAVEFGGVVPSTLGVRGVSAATALISGKGDRDVKLGVGLGVGLGATVSVTAVMIAVKVHSKKIKKQQDAAAAAAAADAAAAAAAAA